ncbi:MAG: hypothetical protein ACD_3C00036G0002 [uncultured bacterium (gcode 4)]|uniref:Uncharacterized protein n=1 Tax=uncultured bacterium (gcode 4) TaxID=1234023 RepID=K2FC93_9BACT|nr:MAG: hypothetical protein ACD_3C00036G0002 [uncultured bacterium (gcode 4)]
MSNFVSVESWLDEVRRNNFFWYWALSSFVWMCFHFTLVFFFLLQLWSPLLVWIFLWLANFVSFLVDSPVWVLQKYFNAKKLFVTSAIMMLVVSVIFLYFIYSAWSIDFKVAPEELFKLSSSAYSKIFGSFLNVLLLMVSVIFYWIIKEFSDVTSLSYIMNNADPSEYAELLSKNNIFSWLGALCWLLASWVILAFNPFFAVSILVGIVVIFILFILKYFDNAKEIFKINVNVADIKKLKLISPKETLESVKEYTVSQVQKADFAQVASNMKFVFLKPMEIKKSVNWWEIIDTAIIDIKSFMMILFQPPYSHRLLVVWTVLTFFWLWDTFVTSFLIDFLTEVINNNQDNFLAKIMSAYAFIAVLAIPAYWAQIPLIWLSKKIWVFPVIMAWVLVSWISILLFWAFTTFGIILLLWVVNSFWYAAAMPLSQWEFSDEYNSVYAEKKNLTEIDSNASSAPLKMLLNLANVVWLIIWWLLVFVVWYPWTFFVFWVFLLTLFVLSLVKRKEWKL